MKKSTDTQKEKKKKEKKSEETECSIQPKIIRKYGLSENAKILME